MFCLRVIHKNFRNMVPCASFFGLPHLVNCKSKKQIKRRGDIIMIHDETFHTLAHYRKRMKLTQFQVARLLGWKNTKGVGQIEAGYSLPTLMTAFKLSVIYRAPVEFLFKDNYEKLRQHIRAREA